MLISVEVFVADAVSSTHGEPLEHSYGSCDVAKIPMSMTRSFKLKILIEAADVVVQGREFARDGWPWSTADLHCPWRCWCWRRAVVVVLTVSYSTLHAAQV